MNNSELENNKVVYINEDTHDEIEENTYDHVEQSTNLVNEENTRIVVDDSNNKEEEEQEEYEEFANKDDLLLNLKQSGYESDGGDISDSESVATTDILKIDPLYLRLTKFLQTNDGESVAETLKKINEQLVTLNANLSTHRLNSSV